MSKDRYSIKIFYIVADFYPAWRLDLSELFSVQLAKRGLDLSWSLWRDTPGSAGWLEQYGQPTFVAGSCKGHSILSRVLNKLLQSAADIRVFFHLLFGPHYDIIQVRDQCYFAAGLGLLAARLRGVKFVYWLSFPFPENDKLKVEDTQGMKKYFYQMRGQLSTYWLYRFVFPKADHIFVQSEQMQADILERYHISLEKMTPVPMGVPSALLDWTAKHPAEIVKGRVIYTGTFVKERKLEVLIEAFAVVKQQVPHAELWLVGDGTVPEERKMLEQLVEKRQLTDSVHFTGFVPMEQAWSSAASAEVCVSPVYPSFVLRPGSPTKLNEYMALARPCVANDHPEQAATLQESGAGLSVPWGSKDFAEAIIWLLKHPREAEEMGRKGPDWVKVNRTYDQIAEKVFSQYVTILD